MGAEKAGLAPLREALEKHRRRQKYGKFPERLRHRAYQYAKERLDAGGTTSVIAQELGVSPRLAARWAREGKALKALAPRAPLTGALSFVPVVVKSEQPECRAARLEVDFPDGTRLQAFGIGPDALGSTIEALRGRR
jgi:transposase-like protein